MIYEPTTCKTLQPVLMMECYLQHVFYGFIIGVGTD